MVWIPHNPHMAELGHRRQPRGGADLPAIRCRTASSTRSWPRPSSTPGRRWSPSLEAKTPATFQIVKASPTTTRSTRGQPGGGRSLECPLFPFDELGPWADRVTVGPQIGRNITMSETSLGRGAPGGVPPRSWSGGRSDDERGAGQGLVGRLLKGCLDRGIEPRTGAAAP